VLFTVMEFAADANRDSPGFVLSDAIVNLYERVKANPQDYPRGMTVRILLGNYPEVSSFEWGSQIWHVLQDLKDAGLPTMSDPELGWKVEVANFDGQFPHSHAKFLVVDGSAVAAAGINYSYLHLSDLHPSGQGINLVDLAMAIAGPVAQASQRTFDDMWEGANQVNCPDLEPTLGRWELACDFTKAKATHVPEVLRYYLPPDDDIGFSLFRNTNYHESDEAVVAAIRSAEQTLDVWEVNFSWRSSASWGWQSTACALSITHCPGWWRWPTRSSRRASRPG
jgi:phosphatidylserine/phosphatidylglycerophosphate/cardiolipin synthase-like enzyme